VKEHPLTCPMLMPEERGNAHGNGNEHAHTRARARTHKKGNALGKYQRPPPHTPHTPPAAKPQTPAPPALMSIMPVDVDKFSYTLLVCGLDLLCRLVLRRARVAGRIHSSGRIHGQNFNELWRIRLLACTRGRRARHPSQVRGLASCVSTMRQLVRTRLGARRDVPSLFISTRR
jgi:hypothetical protein